MHAGRYHLDQVYLDGSCHILAALDRSMIDVHEQKEDAVPRI